jgi:hypothetical protein
MKIIFKIVWFVWVFLFKLQKTLAVSYIFMDLAKCVATRRHVTYALSGEKATFYFQRGKDSQRWQFNVDPVLEVQIKI